VVTEEAKLNTYNNQLQKYITSRRDKEKGLEAFQKKVEKIKQQIRYLTFKFKIKI
jgi:hypothetical protein